MSAVARWFSLKSGDMAKRTGWTPGERRVYIGIAVLCAITVIFMILLALAAIGS